MVSAVDAVTYTWPCTHTVALFSHTTSSLPLRKLTTNNQAIYRWLDRVQWGHIYIPPSYPRQQVLGSKPSLCRISAGVRLCFGYSLPQTPLAWEPLALGLSLFLYPRQHAGNPPSLLWKWKTITDLRAWSIIQNNKSAIVMNHLEFAKWKHIPLHVAPLLVFYFQAAGSPILLLDFLRKVGDELWSKNSNWLSSINH
jgi:hypothetical protein